MVGQPGILETGNDPIVVAPYRCADYNWVMSNHGRCHTSEYRTWAAIKDRCINPKSANYSKFGGMGVTMYRPWAEDFSRFYTDVGPKPSPRHRLQRYPDKKGNYEPGNLRWYLCGEEVRTELVSPQARDMVGRTFGKLRVVGAYGVRLGNGKPHTKVECVCQCGTRLDIFSHSLAKRKVLSCGSRSCAPDRFQKTTGSRNYKFKGYRDIRSATWNRIQKGAERRGLCFELSLEYAWNLYEKQDRRCALSGVPLVFKGGTKSSLTTASLDRIDIKKGYVEGNVQWVHKTVNIMRNALELEDFVVWCSRVAKNSLVKGS